MDTSGLPENLQSKLQDYYRAIEGEFTAVDRDKSQLTIEQASESARELAAQVVPDAFQMGYVLMMTSNSDTVRASLVKYFIDKVIGKDAVLGETDPLRELLKKLSQNPDPVEVPAE